MKLARSIAGWSVIAALVCLAAPAHGEEILLKNGQKIVGTIVGYEKDMFRVETDYGIALVRKDKVVSIQVSKPEEAKSSPESAKRESPKSPETKPGNAARPESTPTVSPAATPAVANHQLPTANAGSSAATTPPEAKPSAAARPEITPTVSPAATAAITLHQSATAKTDSPVAITPAPSASQPPPPAPAKPPAPPPPPVSHLLDVPLPAHLDEHVDGNTYFNDTFQFSMFKPPDWKIYEGVPKETGSGIMAMGTEDEQTLLIVDRQVWSGAPKLTTDQVEAKLRQTYQEYRRISEEAFECDGQTATRQTFTGVLDGAEWHGVAVHVIHGNMVFGIIGLTSAETFQFQEAIFNKIIKTFHFLTPAPSTSALWPVMPAP